MLIFPSSNKRSLRVIAALVVVLPMATAFPTTVAKPQMKTMDLLGKNYTECDDLGLYEYTDKAMEAHHKYTAQNRDNNSFLLFQLHDVHLEAKHCGTSIYSSRFRRSRSRSRGRPSRPVAVVPTTCRRTLRKEHPQVCLKQVFPSICENPQIFDASGLREQIENGKFMAVWNWKLDRYTCLQFNIDYRNSNPNDLLYHMSTNRGIQEVIHSSGTTYVYSGSTSTDVSLVFVHQSQMPYTLQFRAIQFNHTSCTHIC